MNRKQRRTLKLKGREVEEVIKTATVRVVFDTPDLETALYWEQVPDAKSRLGPRKKHHGPFHRTAREPAARPARAAAQDHRGWNMGSGMGQATMSALR
jgi:hypothetical protein